MDLSVGMRAFARGERAHLAEDYATAHACYLEADERGVAAGGRLIAMMYQCGLGRRVDMTEAVRWWRRSLELDLNYAEVLYNLALSLQQGIGVATDEALALAYFRRSADLGFPEGMTSVANALFFGYGCQSACPEGSDRVVAQGFGQGGALLKKMFFTRPRTRATPILPRPRVSSRAVSEPIFNPPSAFFF
ncbi:hypothetical protein T492DRAFT_413117 [Pavlovales sp. CCMP2436]|nr:hypothetical protein T492DRAFT_413117 [Pavlovales sp. CCMP2436]|mmetsp:Transcript_51733/g.121545  ORF Transcript_51733/g.121545 Transcript_51733/m.121545 type:complete len:191 (-) Transcript_51733:29-601(-)